MTVKNEIVTLNAAWNWAAEGRSLSRPLPKKGVRYPKTAEKPPFQTWEEIERKIARGGLIEAEEAELWECLFLTLSEITELLSYVESQARHPFLHPMVVFAAHTGARRSEMLRSEIDDIDFAGQTVVIRERKRVRGKLSTRRAPLSPQLQYVLRRWLKNHPGGKHNFTVFRYGTMRDLPGELQEALIENTRSPVSEQAAFRVDFPTFLAGQSGKKRKVANLLAVGNRATDVARTIGVCPGRITQIRRELFRDWQSFQSKCHVTRQDSLRLSKQPPSLALGDFFVVEQEGAVAAWPLTLRGVFRSPAAETTAPMCLGRGDAV